MVRQITDSMDINLRKLWEIVEDIGAWHAALHEVTKSQRLLNNSNIVYGTAFVLQSYYLALYWKKLATWLSVYPPIKCGAIYIGQSLFPKLIPNIRPGVRVYTDKTLKVSFTTDFIWWVQQAPT